MKNYYFIVLIILIFVIGVVIISSGRSGTQAERYLEEEVYAGTELIPLPEDVITFQLFPYYQYQEFLTHFMADPSTRPLITRFLRRINYPFSIDDLSETIYLSHNDLNTLQQFANFFNLFQTNSAVLFQPDDMQPFIAINITNLPVSYNPLTQEMINDKNPPESKIKIFIDNVIGEDGISQVIQIIVNIRNDLLSTRNVNYRNLILPPQSYTTLWFNEDLGMGENYLFNQLDFVLVDQSMDIQMSNIPGSRVLMYNINFGSRPNFFNPEEGFNRFFAGRVPDIINPEWL